MKGTMLLIVGQVLGQIMAFLRNIIVARLLIPEDFGIAATFTLVVTMLEMVSNLSVDRLLVQAEDGDELEFQSTAHAFQVLRGLLVAAFVFLLAWPFSHFFGIPHTLWAFQCVALVPLIRGFVHLDPKRLHRRLDYWRDVVSELVPQLVMILIAWPLALWLNDFSTMLWLLVVQVVGMVLLTHALAERRYAWSLNYSVLKRMLTFGWPLLLNGLLLFLILQGDRFLIGSSLGMSTLAIYTVAFLITSIPAQVVTKVAAALLLPVLSKSQQEPNRFIARYTFTVQALCLIGSAMATVFLFVGHRIVVLTYGPQYDGVNSFIGWLAIMQSIRLLRVVPTIASMAWGDSLSILIGNIGRASFFPGVVVVALLHKPLVWIVLVACAGEVVALAILVFRLRKLYALPTGASLKPMVLTGLSTGLSFAVLSKFGHDTWLTSIVCIVVILFSTVTVMICLFPDFRRTLGATV